VPVMQQGHRSLSSQGILGRLAARVAVPIMDSLGRLYATKIQAVEGVTRTLTCPVVHL
jgi:hypothetical protein